MTDNILGMTVFGLRTTKNSTVMAEKVRLLYGAKSHTHMSKKRKAKPLASPRKVSPRPSHFLSLRFGSAELKEKVRDIQRHVIAKNPSLEPCAVPLEKLHVTLFVLPLLTDGDVKRAVEAFEACKPIIKKVIPEGLVFDISEIGTFKGDVLFVNINDTEGGPGMKDTLSLLRKKILDMFITHGVLTRDQSQGLQSFHPHITIMKTSRVRFKGSRPRKLKILKENYEDVHSTQLCVGHQLKELQLLQMAGTGIEGYYPVVASIPLPITVSKPQKVLFLLDFDGTLTTADTTTRLLDLINEEHQPVRRELEAHYMKGVTDLLAQVSSNNYVHPISTSVAAPLYTNTSYSHSATVLGPHYSASNRFNKEKLEMFLKQWDKHCIESVSRTESSQILRGVKRESICLQAQTVSWHDGIHDVMNKIKQTSTAEAHIVSVNWSSELISLACQHIDIHESITHIHANKVMVENEKDTETNGSIEGSMHGAFDKKEKLHKIVSSVGRNSFVVSIGDSVTDLLMLLESDIGILLCTKEKQQREMNQFCKSFGIKLQPLSQQMDVYKDKEDGLIWMATDWADIHSLVSALL
eukprot:m.323310 g.323310  ORF g.323310 m.323310 type:complete len:580 (+) comp16538_c1_seq29:7-1746(+)